jgi:hypothetical protein
MYQLNGESIMTSNIGSVVTPIADAVSAAVNGTPAVPAAAAVVATVAAILPLPEVVALLKSAAETQKSVYDSIRKAAQIAAASMSPNLSAGEKVKQVMAIYAGTFAEINDANVKANFSANLWIHAAPKVLIEIPAVTKPGEAKATQLVEASKVAHASKAVITDAAKQLRQVHDVNRAPGGGVRTKVLAPTAAGTAAAVAAVSVSDAAPTFFEMLEQRMNDAGDFARIVAAIEKRGYTVRKASVTPAAGTTVTDSTAALASALAETVPSTALAQAAAKATAAARAKAAK